MRPFVINGDLWTPVRVGEEDPRLFDRTGERRVATTDPSTMCVYLSEELRGAFLEKVLTHEIGHCAIVSYGLLPSIHSMAPPEKWVELEEWVCNFVANYGREVIHACKVATGLPFGI